MVVKPRDLSALFEEVQTRVNSSDSEAFEEEGQDGMGRGYRWMKRLAFNKAHPDILVNDLDYWERREANENTVSGITTLELRRDNGYQVMREGRSRWKLENEMFNTLKPQGYQLEHN